MATVVRNDVLHRGVSHVSDRIHSGRCGARDRAEVVRERENGPAVGHCAKLSVRGVGQVTVVDELGTDDNVLAGLPRLALGVECGVVSGALLKRS